MAVSNATIDALTGTPVDEAEQHLASDSRGHHADRAGTVQLT